MWIILRGRSRKASPPPPNRKKRRIKKRMDHKQGKKPPPTPPKGGECLTEASQDELVKCHKVGTDEGVCSYFQDIGEEINMHYEICLWRHSILIYCIYIVCLLMFQISLKFYYLLLNNVLEESLLRELDNLILGPNTQHYQTSIRRYLIFYALNLTFSLH